MTGKSFGRRVNRIDQLAQNMLINEYRLTPIEPAHRKRLEFEMEKFFFGDGSAAPKEYVKPE